MISNYMIIDYLNCLLDAATPQRVSSGRQWHILTSAFIIILLYYVSRETKNLLMTNLSTSQQDEKKSPLAGT